VTLTFIQLAPFAAKWKRLRLTDEDLVALETMLLDDPNAGAVMQGTGGLRKVRFAPPSWHMGKSGAARVCYAHFAVLDSVCFVTLFAKTDQANLTRAERNDVATVLQRVREGLRKTNPGEGSHG
jgi:hypothetical protein